MQDGAAFWPGLLTHSPGKQQRNAIQEKALGGFAGRAHNTDFVLPVHDVGRETFSELDLV